MSTLHFSVNVLRHTQQLQYLLRKLSPADIVAGEAKYTKECLSAFFRRQTKPVLVKCQGEIKYVGDLLNYSCLHFEDFRSQIESISL